jgi:capsular exopolysaccharide synthesis family protein
MATSTAEVLDLRDYVQVLRLRKWSVVATTFLVAGLALAQALTQAETYQSIAKVLVLPVTIPGTEIAPNQQILMPNELEVATSASVAEIAARNADALGAPLGTVRVTAPTDTQTLVFEGYARDPRSAQVTAQTYADAYLEFRRGNLLSSINARLVSVGELIDDLENRRDQLLADLAEASPQEAQAIQFQLNSINSELQLRQQEHNELSLAAEIPVGRILQEATAPQGPYSPRPLRNLAIGLVLGLVLGVGLALLRDRLDQRLRGSEDVEAVAGAPVLGRVPRAPSLHRLIAVGRGGDAHAAEAFRALRTRVLFGSSKEGFRTVMITSSAQGEGKTTVAANLAAALAQADTRIVLVSADLHHPGLWRYLPERGKGLADVLAGTASLDETLVPTTYDHLSFLPSGTIEDVPEAALGSADMFRVLEQLAERADLVVIDAPPVPGVSDTLDLASLVDRVVLVVDASQANKDRVREAVSELRSVGATILGAVLTRVDPGRFGYAYTYRYGARREAQDQHEPTETLPAPAPVPAPQGSRSVPTRGSASASARPELAPVSTPPPPARGARQTPPAEIPPRRDAGAGDG